METQKQSAGVLDREIPLARGVNVATFEGRTPVTEIPEDSWLFDRTIFDDIFQKGFDHIRLPVDFFKATGPAPDYTIDPAFFAVIDRTVDASLAAGLKTIVDFHHFREMQTDVNGNKQRYYQMWTQVARHYAAYPPQLVLELFNEPGNGGAIRNGGPDVVTGDKIMEIQIGAIERIRQISPDRLIVVSPRWNNNPMTLKDTVLPDDDNLILSVHLYEPMDFTHQGATWTLKPYLTKRAFTDDVRDASVPYLNAVKEFRETTGKPVYLGEFGTMRNLIDMEERNKYAEFIVQACDEIKMGWCWWEFHSGFGVYDLKTRTWNGGTADALLKSYYAR